MPGAECRPSVELERVGLAVSGSDAERLPDTNCDAERIAERLGNWDSVRVSDTERVPDAIADGVGEPLCFGDGVSVENAERDSVRVGVCVTDAIPVSQCIADGLWQPIRLGHTLCERHAEPA